MSKIQPQSGRSCAPSRGGLKKGESLVEVIIAIFVVALGSGVATSLIVSALQANQFSRDNLVALNLAVEGVEAIRAIRDADWVKFSYDKPGCWNMRPEVSDCQSSPAPIAAGNYTVDLDLTPNKYGWNLPSPPIGAALNLDSPAGNDSYRLGYYDINISVDSDGLGGINDDHDVLATKGIPSLPMGVASSGDSPYYRMINVSYASGGTCDTSTGENCEEMDVTSTVQWRSQAVTHKVVISGKLTDYQKVKVQ